MDESKVVKRWEAPTQAAELLASSSPLSSMPNELSDPSAFLDAIFENIPHMIFVKDAERLAFSRFNRAGEELLGVPRSALLGKTDHDFWPPEQVEYFIRKDRETLAGGKLLEIDEEPIQTARGLRWLRTKKIPLRDSSGVPRFLLGISEDITEQKRICEDLQRTRQELEQRVALGTAQLERSNQELAHELAERKLAEEALRRSEEQLQQAQKMEAAGRLARGVAHDFNNLLTVIAGYAEALLNDGNTTPAVKDDLTQISRAAEQAASLTRQLLAFSRRQVSSESGLGSTLEEHLPATPKRPIERPPPQPECAFPPGQPIRVLLVEDDEMVRSVARRVLEQRQMRVVEAENASKALLIFNESPADFDVVVSDVVMPGMSGPALVELLLLTRPDLKVLYMSGYANDALVNHSVVERGFLFLQKPFAPAELVKKVRELAAAAAEAAPH